MARRRVYGERPQGSSVRHGSLGFQPYAPPPIPAGSYDPALDAQVGAAQRGYLDTRQDTETAGTRDTVDYGLGVDAINRGSGRSQADLNLSRDRGYADLQTQATQADEDHNRAVGLLTRNYDRLGTAQGERQNQAGVLRGGAALQAAAKRAANMGVERQGIDTSWQRTQGGITTARTRLGEDYSLRSGRLGEDTSLGLADLALKQGPPDANSPLGGRSFQDRGTALARAGRELQAFGLDVEGQKAYQAAGAGYVPPGRGEPGGMPSNEYVNGAGAHHRVIIRGNERLVVDPSGRVISRRRR